MEFFILILMIGLVVGWILVSARFRDLERAAGSAAAA
jgi:hypothetical protein